MSFGRGLFGNTLFGRGAAATDASVISPVAALLADPQRLREHLVVAEPLDSVTGARPLVCLSARGFASGISDALPDGGSLPHQLFRQRLRSPLNIERRFLVNGSLVGEGSPAYGEIEILNPDGELNYLLSLLWDRAPVRYYQGLPEWELRDFVRVFPGSVFSMNPRPATISLNVRDITHRLKVSAQTRLYRGLGPCLRFDGVDDFATMTQPCPAGSMTIEAYVRPTTTATSSRVICGWQHEVSGSFAGQRLLFLNSGGTNRLTFRVRNDNGTAFDAVSLTPLPAGILSHVAGVLDLTAGKVRLYVEGELAAETSVSGSWNTVWTTFDVARQPEVGGLYFPGDVDEVRLWSVARSSSQIRELLNREATGTETGLLDLFHFNEATGSTAYSGASTGRTMAITGASWASSLEGGKDVAGKPKPHVSGRRLHFQPILLDPLAFIYQFHDGSMQAVDQLFDRGLSTVHTFVGDVADVQAWTPIAGKYVTCLAKGLSRFGSQPGTLTAHIRGDNEGGYVEDAAGIAQKWARRVLAADEIESGSVAIVSAAKPYPVGIDLRLTHRTIDALIVEVLSYVNAWRLPAREGLLRFGLLDAPGVPIASLTANDIRIDGMEPIATLPPTAQHRLGYALYGATLSGGDFASTVAQRDREDMTLPYRFVASSEGTGSETVEVKTGIALEADAQREVDARQAFRSVERRHDRIPLLNARHQFDVDQDITITVPALNYDAGVTVTITGLTLDEGSGEAWLEVLR